jgi:Ca2+-binding RTX toxin-like protein
MAAPLMIEFGPWGSTDTGAHAPQPEPRNRPRAGQRSAVLALFVLVLLGAPSSASGSYAQVRLQQVTLGAFPSEANNVVVSAAGDQVTFRDSAGIRVGDGCEQLTRDTARCAVDQSLSVLTGDGNDRVEFERSAGEYATTHIGGAFVDGGPGDDIIDVGDVSAGGGAMMATLIGGPGADDLSGRGALVDYSLVKSGPVDVTLDGVANDGNLDDESAGRRDNLGIGVSVNGTDFGDRLVGNDADNLLRGGLGDDHIIGGNGRDGLAGGNGNDTIDARDGEADSVACGGGDDRARIDSPNLDNASNCEHLDALPGLCAPLDRFYAKHSHPPRGRPSRPAAGGFYLGRTSSGQPVRLHVARSRRNFIPKPGLRSHLFYKACDNNHIVITQPADLTGEPITPTGSFDATHERGSRVRRVRGQFFDHGRTVSGVIEDDAGQSGHAGPVIFEATLTPA